VKRLFSGFGQDALGHHGFSDETNLVRYSAYKSKRPGTTMMSAHDSPRSTLHDTTMNSSILSSTVKAGRPAPLFTNFKVDLTTVQSIHTQHGSPMRVVHRVQPGALTAMATRRDTAGMDE